MRSGVRPLSKPVSFSAAATAAAAALAGRDFFVLPFSSCLRADLTVGGLSASSFGGVVLRRVARDLSVLDDLVESGERISSPSRLGDFRLRPRLRFCGMGKCGSKKISIACALKFQRIGRANGGGGGRGGKNDDSDEMQSGLLNSTRH